MQFPRLSDGDARYAKKTHRPYSYRRSDLRIAALLLCELGRTSPLHRRGLRQPCVASTPGHRCHGFDRARRRLRSVRELRCRGASHVSFSRRLVLTSRSHVSFSRLVLAASVPRARLSATGFAWSFTRARVFPESLPMAIACAQCGAPLPEGTRFCGQCGATLTAVVAGVVADVVAEVAGRVPPTGTVIQQAPNAADSSPQTAVACGGPRTRRHPRWARPRGRERAPGTGTDLAPVPSSRGPACACDVRLLRRAPPDLGQRAREGNDDGCGSVARRRSPPRAQRVSRIRSHSQSEASRRPLRLHRPARSRVPGSEERCSGRPCRPRRPRQHEPRNRMDRLDRRPHPAALAHRRRCLGSRLRQCDGRRGSGQRHARDL